MPDAGQDLFEIIVNRPLTNYEFSNLSLKLVNLLTHGIIPMNAAGLVHLDVKLENIVVDIRVDRQGAREQMSLANTARLIDWGLSQVGVGETPHLLIDFYRRETDKTSPFFMYNLPTGYVLLTSTIDADLFNAPPSARVSMMAVARYYVDKLYAVESNRAVLASQGSKIDALLSYTFPDQQQIDFRKETQANHIAAILSRFYNQNVDANQHPQELPNEGWSFDVEGYLNEVFLPNCDIVGLLTAYVQLFDAGLDLHFKSDEASDMFTETARHMLGTFLFSNYYAVKKINVDQLVAKLNKLHNMCTTKRGRVTTTTTTTILQPGKGTMPMRRFNSNG
jgi:nuclear transport factor 2 (NTF2) superfamily protein